MSKILVIEDEALIRESICDVLELNGYETESEPDGEKGLKRASSLKPDLILCDINMPKMDGFEVLNKIKNLVGASTFPPFIFLSAKTEPENIKHALSLGAVDFVSKPYSAPELLKLIQLRLNE